MEAIVYTRRWSRVEYEQMIEKGLFRPDERLELLDGLLLVREPQHDRHALASTESRNPSHHLTP